MRVLFCGDVVGQPGRLAVCAAVKRAKSELGVGFVIVNGENAAGGFGITPSICEEFFAAGVNVITTGNHIWDQREIISHIDSEPRLLRPHGNQDWKLLRSGSEGRSPRTRGKALRPGYWDVLGKLRQIFFLTLRMYKIPWN